MQIEPMLSGVAEIARVFRVRKSTVREWLRSGAPHIPDFYPNGKLRRVLVDRQELMCWLRKRRPM